jgi:hypothetical protein
MQKNILDEVYDQIKRHSKFDHEEQYDCNTLWAVGSYFLGYEDIRVFDNFPMLAFMSPEPDSGKTNALKVTSKLAFNATNPGSFTTAGILRKIDKSKGQIITICLDDLDTKCVHGKDNSDLVMLFNLGYERGALIHRCSQSSDGLIETPAYCPKAFSALSIARIPGATLTRTFIINMRPKTVDDEDILEEIDKVSLEALRKRLEAWAPTIVDQLKAIELPAEDIKFLINRKRQIFRPLLAISKIISKDWYERALNVAMFFTGQQTEKTLTHRILREAYRIFRTGNHADRIHGGTLLEALHELGIHSWLDQSQLASHLATYGIKPRQMKIGNINRNGYDWHSFLKPFATYITKEEEEEVEIEIGIRTKVEEVDKVDTFRKQLEADETDGAHSRLPSTMSTLSTLGTASFKDFARELNQ